MRCWYVCMPVLYVSQLLHAAACLKARCMCCMLTVRIYKCDSAAAARLCPLYIQMRNRTMTLVTAVII
jgi:hypothetical protein